MIALDTNILARLILRDDEAQFQKARALLADGRSYTAPVTVFLELAWVLKSAGYSRDEIAAAIRAVLGLEEIKPQNPVGLTTALLWYEAGLDFADALHLALSHAEEAFLTFDDRFVHRAEREAVSPPVRSA